jgi:hypothetical protein
MIARTIFAACLVLTACAGCNHTEPPAANQPMQPATQPVTLKAGLGEVHHPVSTKHPQAQKFFDQGLAYVYAFNHAEAGEGVSQVLT